jgi:RsiW-degrading membrane proteinase PrsW (M82 family)
MLILVSIAAAIIPLAVYTIIIWKLSSYENKSISLISKGYLYGGFGAIFCSLLLSLFLYKLLHNFFLEENLTGKIEPIVLAPIVEELVKDLFLIFLVRGKKFYSVTQVIILGGALGLGFGMVENLFYYLLNAHSLSSLASLIFYRTFFSAVMHCTTTGFFGAFVGYVIFFNPFTKFSFYLTGAATGIIIHVAWNFCAVFNMLSKFGYVFITIIAAAFISTYIFSLAQEKKYIYNELKEESDDGLIPESHLKFITSIKRNQNGWVDEPIRKAYIKTVTSLVFKKIQCKNAAASKKEMYYKEILSYRNLVSDLLKNTA